MLIPLLLRNHSASERVNVWATRQGRWSCRSGLGFITAAARFWSASMGDGVSNRFNL